MCLFSVIDPLIFVIKSHLDPQSTRKKDVNIDSLLISVANASTSDM